MSRKPGPWRSLLGPLKVIISSGNAYKDNCVPGFTVPSLSNKGARDMPQQQNTKIPIVFEVGVDPVDSELVTSLSRPHHA